MKITDSHNRLLVYPIQDSSDLEAVYRLTYETYLRRGICLPNKEKVLIHNRSLDEVENTCILIAKQNGQIEASLSLTIGQTQEEIYNFDVFKEDLQSEPLENALFFSGWRLAVRKEGPHSRFVVLQLILKGMQYLLQKGVTFGYMSFREEHLQFYRRILPEGYMIGRRQKETELINSELCMWKCYISEEGYTFLHQLVLRLSER